tara:strand:+ start:556 stop:1278 length:723 start_codon:yes stop_codon:yes gene_type:complete
MKRVFVFLTLGVLLISFLAIIPADEPPMPLDGEDPGEELEGITNLTDQIPFDPETGEFNVGKIEGIKLKSQERIDMINEWIAEKAPILGFFFRMIPEISWLFFANLYVILFWFTVFVLNADEFFFFTGKAVVSYLSGVGLFIAFLLTNSYLYLAQLVVNLCDLVLNTILPWGMVAFVAGLILLGVAAVFFPAAAQFIVKIPAKLSGKTGAGGIEKEGKSIIRELEVEKDIARAYNEGTGN